MQLFWGIEGWEKTDFHLKRLAALPFHREIPFIPKNPGLYVIRGPRQVGKSSWLKTVLQYYVQAEGPDQCFYLSCENIESFKELAVLLESIRNRKVILLDEINFVAHWDRAVKHAIDSGQTQILMITGSHSYDLRRGADQLPGRFEEGGEYQLLPMDFEEFHQMRLQAGWALSDRLEELKAYFRIGGFPIAIAEARDSGIFPKKAQQTYLRWLVGDIIKLGKQESLLKELLIQLGVCLQTPISYQTLAKKTSIGSHNTVQEYIAVLESCFALRTLFAVDLDTGAFRFRKDKKFYFSDPLIYWIAQDLSGQNAPKNIEQKLSEMVAHEALCRNFPRFGYLNGKSGEVDFILPKQWAVEVKWSPVASNISKAYQNLTLPWKTVWTHSNFLLELPRQV
jgi:predicted AAA+ superfamily ATPase